MIYRKTSLLLCLHCCTLTDQLAEIRKFRYAKVMCENADYLPYIQPKVFIHPLSVVNGILK